MAVLWWRCIQMIIIIIFRVLSGIPGAYGAATAQISAIYENF
jgi:hypothetical protein